MGVLKHKFELGGGRHWKEELNDFYRKLANRVKVIIGSV